MEPTIFYIAFLLALPLVLFMTQMKSCKKQLPPGSLGLPIFGQTLEMTKAMKENKFEEWVLQRSKKYGSIWKLSLFGTPTVLLHGQAANKFIFTCDENTISNQQPTSFRKILGERNILELRGKEHKRLRGAISSFLNPEALRKRVGKMDEEIRMHLKEHWQHNHEIVVMPSMKTLTFNVICTIVFGVERGARRQQLLHLFRHVIVGTSAIPINLPFTQYNRSLRAAREAKKIIMELIREKREKLEREEIIGHDDLITSLLSRRDEDNSPMFSDEEIIDNCMSLMIAGHDTTSTLLTFFIKVLSEHPHVYQNVLNEQEEIAKEKAPGELLTWDDLNKMKYTWRAATEVLRMYSPIPYSFRKVVQDFEMGGYIIPKGWQVLWTACMTHMDDSIFPDPYEFNPLRNENNRTIQPFTFVAFGGGPRMCPGNEFARTETLTMIHYLVTRFEWKLSLEENISYKDPMPNFKHGLPIQINMKKQPMEILHNKKI